VYIYIWAIKLINNFSISGYMKILLFRKVSCWSWHIVTDSKFFTAIWEAKENFNVCSDFFLETIHSLLLVATTTSWEISMEQNTHGQWGRNVHGNLYLEHLNCLCKAAVNEKGSNEYEMFAFVRKTLGLLEPVLDQFDEENCTTTNSDSQFSKAKEFVIY